MSKPELSKIQNRRKLVAVPHKRALQLLFASKSLQTYVCVPEADLPEGVIVLGVHTDFIRNAFVFEVCHASFDEIPEGVEAPFITVNWTFVDLALPEGREKP